MTYLALDEEGEGVAFLSFSNDSINRELLPRSTFERVVRSISPRSKRHSSMPAVKIGRLATRAALQSGGIGKDMLDYVKYWFTNGNKTGCKFVLVDAYNKPRIIKFYKDNGFDFLIRDEKEETRLMYFDLITFRA